MKNDFVLFVLFYVLPRLAFGQNVIIAVIDGPRLSEVFLNGPAYVPKMHTLTTDGTYFANFRNLGLTLTNPGHAAILSGALQPLLNDGSQRPTAPTLFEYFRKQTNAPLKDNYVIAGKSKLNILTSSTHIDYGSDYSAMFVLAANDRAVYDSLRSIMQTVHPRLILANFPSVDLAAHSGNYQSYVTAIHVADSLIHELWQTIQSLPFYKDSTTLFVTADHGRHDEANGGFQNHGDFCEGCRHIFLLALGRRVPSGQIRTDSASQIDITPTVGELLDFSTPLAAGVNLFSPLTNARKAKSTIPATFEMAQNYPNPFNPSTTIVYSLPEPASTRFEVFNILGQLMFSQDNLNQPPGYHDIVWNAAGQSGQKVSSGVYIYRLIATSTGNELRFLRTMKMVLLR